MEKRFNLTVQEVLDKQFNVDFKGYSSVEVDEFLDLVIADYQEYDEMISTLGINFRSMRNRSITLKAKIIELEGKQDLAEDASAIAGSNVDILKRLTRLENAVFKKQIK